jgi:hypothetical protein
MAFPLAHPVTVLPLRRYCPRVLSLPALIIGSVSPDAGYLFGRLNVDEFSHRLIGSVGFCLPVGLLALWVFRYVRAPLVRLLPDRYRQALEPACQRPLGSWGGLILSVLIGALSHIVLDSFTHSDGWLVEHVALLQAPVAFLGNHTLRMHHLFWYGSTFVGVAWIVLVLQQWTQATTGSPLLASVWVRISVALGMALAVVPLGLVRHLFGHSNFTVLAVAVPGLAIAGFVLGLGTLDKWPLSRSLASKNPAPGAGRT